MPQIGNVEVPDDVIQRLSTPERRQPTLGDIFSSAAQGAFGAVRYGVPYQVERLARTLTPEDELFYQRGLQQTREAASRATPATPDDLFSGRTGVLRFIGENIAASLPYMASSAVGAAGGALVAGPAGAVAGGVIGGTPQFSGTNVARAVEEQGGLSDQAAARSLLVAPVQSAADIAIARFLPGAGGLIGAAPISRGGSGFLRRTAESIAKAGATEAVTEVGQQVAERYAAGIPVSTADAAAEYVNAAVTAFAVGGALGAAGGFRRTAADQKPAQDVTTEDLLERVDATLLRLPPPPDLIGGADGQTRVNPSGRNILALPAPRPEAPVGPIEPELPLAGGSAVEQQPGLPFFGTQEPGSAPPSQLPQLPGLNPSLSAVQPGTQLELGQRFEDNVTPTDVTELGGTTINPQLEQLLQSLAPGRQPDDLRASTTLSRGLVPGEPRAPQVELPPSRIFADVPIDELTTVMRSRNAPADLRQEVERELSARQQETTGQAPLTADGFQTRVDELKTGLRGGFVQRLTATDPADLLNQVYTEIFENANTQANVRKFAQRVGLLDENLQPTPEAARIEQERAQVASSAAVPAAPSAPSAAIPAAPPAPSAAAPAAPAVNPSGNLTASRTPAPLDTPEQVVTALANDETASGASLASRVEQRARELGLITNDDAMDVTPLGRQTWLRTDQGLEERTAEAVRQGYVGAQASNFDRGVAAQIEGVDTSETVEGLDNLAAYQAGKNWAKNFIERGDVATASQTDQARARLGLRVRGDARARTDAAQGPRITAQQEEQRRLNNLISSLNVVRDQDVAQLRSMVRNGATAAEIEAAVQRVQQGQSLFSQPAARPAPETQGARPERRRQPIFREMAREDQAVDTPRLNKTAQRTETEAALRTYDLRQLIDFALQEGGLTQERARRLHDMLDQGKVAQVERALKAFDPDAEPQAAVRRLPRPPEREAALGPDGFTLSYRDAQLEADLDGKSFDEALDHMIENAPSRFHRHIMRAVRRVATQMQSMGVQFDFRIVKPGDTVPTEFASPDIRAYAMLEKSPLRATILLKSSETGRSGGFNYQILAHELLHTVTIASIARGSDMAVYGRSRLGKAVKDLEDLRVALVRHVNARQREGNLTPFEQKLVESYNSLDDPDELLAWGLTNPEMQRYLQSIEYQPKQSVFSRLVELLRSFLGIEGRYDTALTELLRVSEQVLRPDARDLRAVFLRNDPGGGAAVQARAAQDARRTAQQDNDIARDLAGRLGQLAENVGAQDAGIRLRRLGFGWISRNHIDRVFGQLMPALLKHSDAKRRQASVRNRFSQLGVEANQLFERLQAAVPKIADRVSKLMADTTQFQIDPDKTWEEHTHLLQESNADQLKAIYQEVMKTVNDLKRGVGAGWAMFNHFRALNEMQNYARMAVSLHERMVSDPEFLLGVEGLRENNPVEAFEAQENLTSPQQLRDFWQAELDRQVAAALTFIRQKKGAVSTMSEREQLIVRQHFSALELQIRGIFEARRAMSRAPYFHLGRFGDHFGAATVRKTAQGTVDPVALQHVADALQKAGFNDILLSPDNSRARISMRFEKADQARRFRAVMEELKAQGWLDPEAPIAAGPRNRESNYGLSQDMPDFVSRFIDAIESSPAYQVTDDMSSAEQAAVLEAKQRAIKIAVDTWIEQLPDTSISKVLVKRYNVPGASSDMIRNWNHRWNVGSINIAGIYAAPKINEAFTEMRAQAREATEDGRGDEYRVNDVLREIRLREASNPVNEISDAFDKLTAVAHAYYLGFSPAYGLVNMTQLGVVALPELAKKHGYGRSFHAMRRSSGKATKILAEAFREAQEIGGRHRADVTLTPEVLRKAGLSPREIAFVNRMIAAGSIDLGSMARSAGQLAGVNPKSKFETSLKYASAIGLYTETFSRLTTALAAYDLHEGDLDSAERYAVGVVSNSMFDFQNWNTARQLGKRGFAGPITPLLTQFMSYTVQVTEKLYSEFVDSIGKQRAGETAEQARERRAGAQRFVLGHITAVTALAGTLGMPFASAFAAVIERMVDAFGDDEEPFDATAAWRGFLADVLGKEVGEVAARGLPRALGFDVSQRVGEADLLPFTRLLSDRRGWQESVEDYLGRSVGAAPNMLISIAEGGAKFANGDVLGGMKDFLPVALKGPVETYRMTEEGFVDSRGQRLPMTPNASAYLWQLIGFSPAQRAEYSEARRDQQTRRGVITRRAAQLRQQIIKELGPDGDRDRARELIAEAQEFDRDNPNFSVLDTLLESLQRGTQVRQRAAQLQAPMGVALQDIAGQRLTDYANIEYR